MAMALPEVFRDLAKETLHTVLVFLNGFFSARVESEIYALQDERVVGKSV